jgi:hypothetical protein
MSERPPGGVEAGEERQPGVIETEQERQPGVVEAGRIGTFCACTLFAVVLPDGTLARGFRAISSMRFQPGWYEVGFNRDVSACAFSATIGSPTGSVVTPSGQITVQNRLGDNFAVFITTTDSAGTYADRGFHLAVHCRS